MPAEVRRGSSLSSPQAGFSAPPIRDVLLRSRRERERPEPLVAIEPAWVECKPMKQKHPLAQIWKIDQNHQSQVHPDHRNPQHGAKAREQSERRKENLKCQPDR